ncbi:uncharacterized protein BcabD6B2_41140 [Babesia caballi]|uniref:Uncharacterized protein n=1 Tax=Babesia caballi TaxID=5871 RepID=A0AAV4M1L2_BABCB|nr:hypothetical protein, conserved [Babesia caballi]
MTPGKKSLTDPPKNLKEAIDWVIQIKDDNEAIKGLAKELQEMLKHDGSEVAMKVLDKYRLVSESVIRGLKSHTNEKNRLTSLSSEWGFAAPYAALDRLSRGLDPFDPQSAAHVNRKTLEHWVSKVQEKTLETLISELATSLEKFITSTSGILTSLSSESTYKSDAKWESLQAAERKECAIIFLAILPLLYIGLTYLYWRCTPDAGSTPSNISWSGQKLTDDKGLKKYIEALGYNENLNDQNTGGKIVSEIMNNMFSGELKSANVSSNSYPEFLEKLQGEAPKSTPSTTSPLTYLYRVSYYYITHPIYDVQSTSPVTPTFAGYSGTAAMAGGAYGFNLGGLGTIMSALLA